MALLINKLFASKKKAYGKHQDVCERAFTFSKEQVRVVLFRECDFRGRKLLFDSQTVQKVPITTTVHSKQPVTLSSANIQCCKSEIYVEISSGYGYQYARPSGDTVHLGEMIFGSVAMSFRGTSFKIHSFSSPSKLMCTQVFPSPKVSARGRISVTNNIFALKSNSSIQSLDKSLKLDYSSASSSTSFNEHTSGHSTESDIKIVAYSGSVPLDVPLNGNNTVNSKHIPSLEGDSGFCGEQSDSSVSSEPPWMSFWDSRQEHVNHGFSCGSLYKRWLRSASTSLDYNTCSDSSLSGVHSSVSADECMIRGHHRSSKLGLAVIIQLSEEQEFEMERFILEHAALMEAMVSRARTGAEAAYARPGSFASLMYDVYRETCHWLSDLITGPTISIYLWHVLGSQTNKYCGISDINKANRIQYNNRNNSLLDFTKTKSESSLLKVNSASDLINRTKNNVFSVSSLEVDSDSKGIDIGSFKSSIHRSFSRHLRSDIFKCDVDKLTFASARMSSESSLYAEKFVRELCELLESVDVKHTKFFISTLLTAVLTHHLGWVSTVLPPSQLDKETISKLHAPCNPLWGQLTDLYGAVGYPTKMSRTVVCGNNKGEIITKILNMLTYFIRCSSVERNHLANFSPYDVNCETEQKNIFNFNDMNFQESEIKMCDRISNRFKEIHQNGECKKTEELEMGTLKPASSRLKCENVSFEHTPTENKSKKTDNKRSNNLTQQAGGKDFLVEPEDQKNEMKKVKSCLGDLCSQSDNLQSFNYLDISKFDSKFEISKNLYNQTSQNFIPKNSSMDTSHSSLLRKNESFSNLAILMNTETNKFINEVNETNVVFVLGDNEELVGLKKTQNNIFKVDEQCVVNENICKENIVTNSLSEEKLNIPSNSNLQRPKDLKIPSKMLFSSGTSDSSPDENSASSNCVGICADISPCSECEKLRKRSGSLQPGTSKDTDSKVVVSRSSTINLESEFGKIDDQKAEIRRREDFNRSQSVPPSDKSQRKCSKNGCKKKYSGVKFDIRQYPQIVKNYMKSKDLELSQLPFGEKALKLNRSFSTTLYDNCLKFDLPTCDCEPHDREALQTPSNASELEFTSDLVTDLYESHNSRSEKKPKPLKESCFLKLHNSESVRITELEDLNVDTKIDSLTLEHSFQGHSGNENNAIFEHEIDNYEEKKTVAQCLRKMVYVDLPLPRIIMEKTNKDDGVGYTRSLLRGVSDKYISDMVLQGTTSQPRSWEHMLKRDLNLAARQPLLDQPIQEAVAIVANTDTWEVQIVSSHTYIVERGSPAIHVCMSQLVANMLESLLDMWKLKTPSEYCLMHIEARLREFCLRSKALAQLLMTTEFCNMDLLTSTLQLEVNDIPLLMAVASTHTPQVTQKYGLSFQ